MLFGDMLFLKLKNLISLSATSLGYNFKEKKEKIEHKK